MTTSDSGKDSGETSNGIYFPVTGAAGAAFLRHVRDILSASWRDTRQSIFRLFSQQTNRDTVSEISGPVQTTLANSWLAGRLPADTQPAQLPIIDHRLSYPAVGPFSPAEISILADPFNVSNGHLPNSVDWDTHPNA